MSCKINGLNVSAIKYGSQNITKVIKGTSSGSEILFENSIGPRFVAVGNGVSFYLEDNKTNWVPLSGISGTIRCVSYGNGRFFAGGPNGEAYYLTDKNKKWESILNTSGYSLYSTSYGQGAFYSVGGTKYVYKLSDGCYYLASSQLPKKSAGYPTLTCIYSGVRGVVGIGLYSGISTVAYYLSGSSWTEMGISETLRFNSIAYGDQKFIAVGKGGAIYVTRYLVSSVSWSQETSGTLNTLHCVAYGGNRFVAVGDAGTTLYQNNDSIYWSSLTGASGNLRSVSYGNGRFVAVGENGESFSLEDGKTQWTSLTGLSGACYGIAYGN